MIASTPAAIPVRLIFVKQHRFWFEGLSACAVNS